MTSVDYARDSLVGMPYRLRENGFVVLDGLLDRANVIDPVLDELAAVVSATANSWMREGLLPRTWESSSLEEQILAVTKETFGKGLRPLTYYTDITLPKGKIEANNPIYLGEACFRLLTAPSLLDAVSEVIGPEIWLSPVAHLRIKVPQSQAPPNDTNINVTDWHQDNGVVLEEADGLEVLTVWIPLTKATVENGCLRVVPAQRDRELLLHCERLAIPDQLLDLEAAVPLPMEVGSALFLHPRTPHSSFANITQGAVRISLDLRYQPCAEPTGRPQFPAFCVRNPDGPVATWKDWRHGWLDARDRLSDREIGPFDRWASGDPGCA